MCRSLFRHFIPLLLLASPAAAQDVRTSASLGATWLDFTLTDFGALSAHVRIRRDAQELTTLLIIPFGVATASADCPQETLCFGSKTPDALFGAIPSLSANLGSPGWRASLGLGGILAKGIERPERSSSIVGSIGLDWTSVSREGLTPTVGVRALGLAWTISGLRYVIVPSIGISF